MPAFIETGHAKNIANFQTLIAFIEGYGGQYNPSKGSLKLQELRDLLHNAEAKLAQVLNKNTDYNNAVNDRISEFSPLKPLATRVVNALQSTDASDGIIKEAKAFNRKLQGKRASQPDKPIDPNQPVPTTISSSQQSYDQQIQHFAGLITVLQTEPTYTPNETDLAISSLTAKRDALIAKNAAVATAYTTVSNARIDRNNVLYNNETGLVETSTEVKKYIKSVFGGSSPQYNQVSGIQINKIKS